MTIIIEPIDHFVKLKILSTATFSNSSYFNAVNITRYTVCACEYMYIYTTKKHMKTKYNIRNICMFVYLYNAHTYMCAHTCMHTHMCICTYVCMHPYVRDVPTVVSSGRHRPPLR